MRFGAKDRDIFSGTINAGHPGKMLPLTTREAESLHHDRLPENLCIADATLLPEALGNPSILTIVALPSGSAIWLPKIENPTLEVERRVLVVFF